MISVRSTDQLRCDAQTVVGSAHTALENGAHVQLFSDTAQVDMFTLEGEGRTSRDDTKLLNLGQCVDDFLRDSVGKVFVLRIRAHVHERQYHDGIAYRAFSRDRRSDGGTDRCDQPVASFGDSLDDAWIAGVVVEGAA
jgi:hypothetical protein